MDGIRLSRLIDPGLVKDVLGSLVSPDTIMGAVSVWMERVAGMCIGQEWSVARLGRIQVLRVQVEGGD